MARSAKLIKCLSKNIIEKNKNVLTTSPCIDIMTCINNDCINSEVHDDSRKRTFI